MNKRGWPKDRKRGAMPKAQREKIRATKKLNVVQNNKEPSPLIPAKELPRINDATAIANAGIHVRPNIKTITAKTSKKIEKKTERIYGKKYIQDRFGQYHL